MTMGHEWSRTVVLMTNGPGACGLFHSCSTVRSPPRKGNHEESKEK